MNNFERHLNDHLRQSFPTAEIVSDVLGSKGLSFQNADYFFENRQIIGELKCLEDELHPKIQKYVYDAMDEGKFPLFYGRMRVDQVLQDHPNKEQINKEINDLVITSLEACVEKANRQIRETKEYFSLPSSRGFVFINNRSNLSLEPKTAFWNLHKMINKRNQNGGIRYESIHSIIYTSDLHCSQKGTMEYSPFLKLLNDVLPGHSNFDEDFLDKFGNWFAGKVKGINYIKELNLKVSDVMNWEFQVRDKGQDNQ